MKKRGISGTTLLNRKVITNPTETGGALGASSDGISKNESTPKKNAGRPPKSQYEFDDASEEIIFFDDHSSFSSILPGTEPDSDLPSSSKIESTPNSELRERRETTPHTAQQGPHKSGSTAYAPWKSENPRQTLSEDHDNSAPDPNDDSELEDNLSEEMDTSIDDDEDFEFSTDSEEEAETSGAKPTLNGVESQLESGSEAQKYDLILVASSINAKATNNIKTLSAKAFVQHLSRIGIQTDTTPIAQNSKLVFLKLRATFDFLADTAETLELAMPIAPNDLAQEVTKIASWVARFFFGRPIKSRPPVGTEYKDHLMIPYQRKLHKYFMQAHGKSEETLFSPLQRSFMVRYELSQLKIALRETFIGEFDVSDEESDADDSHIITFEWLRNHGLIQSEFLLHDCTNKMMSEKPPKREVCLRRWLANTAGSFKQVGTKMPLDQLQQYLGPQLGFYFAWMEHYTKFLIVPAIISVIVLLIGIQGAVDGSNTATFCSATLADRLVCRQCPEDHCRYKTFAEYCDSVRFSQIFDNLTNTFFSWVISLWAVVFLETWSKKERELAERWRTSSKLQRREDEVRPHFVQKVRTVRKNQITGEPEPWLDRRAKCRRLSWSLAWTLVALASMLSAMFGLIMYRFTMRAILEDSSYSQAMGLSPDNFAIISASMINLVVINLSEAIFRPIAMKLTVHELPRTIADFDFSYTYKIYIFQFFNYYSVILYLAFAEGIVTLPPHQITNMVQEQCPATGCMQALLIQLGMIMTVRQVIQNLIQLIVPIVKAKLKTLMSRTTNTTQWEQDYNLVECPQPVAFAEYSEKIMQYGFITMFSPVFPITTMFALLNNILKMRMDASKYLRAYRRPVPHAAASIGSWSGILQRLTTFSVLVNVVLISFNSTGITAAIYVGLKDAHAINMSFHDFTYSRFRTSDYNSSTSRLHLGAIYYRTYLDERGEDSSRATWNNFITMLRTREVRGENITEELVEECYYRGWFTPPESPEPYKLSDMAHTVLLVQLVMVFVFQNSVMLATACVRSYLSRSTIRASRKTQREGFIDHELNMRSEQDEDEKGSEDVTDGTSGKHETGPESDTDSDEKNRSTSRKRGLCWSALCRKLELFS